MKTKYLFLALICFGASYMNWAQDTQPPPDTKAPYNLLRADLSKRQASSEGPAIDVLFFDINHDGIPEALISARENIYGGGARGNDWILHQFKDGEWQMTPPYKTDDEYPIAPLNCVFARGDDFFSLIRKGENPKLALIYSWESKEDEGIKYSQDACEITMDAEGFLKTIPIPELTSEYVVVWDDIDNDRWPESPKFEYELVPLQTEAFLSPGENKYRERRQREIDGDLPPVITAEVQDGSGGIPAVATLPTAGDRRYLWLYVAIALALCGVFYFVRKKTSH